MTEALLTKLKEVAASGDENSFSDILTVVEASDDINFESNLTEQGSTILMILAAMGRHDLICILLKQTVSPAVDQTNNNGTTALVFACSMGHISCVKVLCEAGANVNWAIGSRDTPVMVAAEEGFDDIVSYLCNSHSVDMELKNELGQTALLCACDQGHLSTVTILLDSGASLEAADNCQATALVIACTNGFVDIARLLLQRGASTACISEAILTMKCDKEESSADTVNAVKAALIALLSSYGWVPALDLQRSCQQNDAANVKRLLSSYPQLSAAVYDCCCAHTTPDDGGSHVPAVVYGGGASPLMIACLHNALKVVEVLVTEYPGEHALAGSDKASDLLDGRKLLEARSEDGRTCLFYAAWSGALPVAEYLLGACPNILNSRNAQGRSALYYACHNGHVDFVQFLLSSGAEKEGILPSDLAAMPMRYSAFQAQNNNSRRERPSEELNPSVTPPSGENIDKDVNVDVVDVTVNISDTDRKAAERDDGSKDRSDASSDEHNDEASAAEEARTSICTLMFGS